MAMTLRLTDAEADALRTYAARHGQSMQQAAQEAIRLLVHNERRDALSRMLIERDRELLDRLAK